MLRCRLLTSSQGRHLCMVRPPTQSLQETLDGINLSTTTSPRWRQKYTCTVAWVRNWHCSRINFRYTNGGETYFVSSSCWSWPQTPYLPTGETVFTWLWLLHVQLLWTAGASEYSFRVDCACIISVLVLLLFRSNTVFPSPALWTVTICIVTRATMHSVGFLVRVLRSSDTVIWSQLSRTCKAFGFHSMVVIVQYTCDRDTPTPLF